MPQATAYGNKNEFLFLWLRVQTLLRFAARYSFVRSGIINVNTGRLRNAGINQDVWSSRAGTEANAYNLTLNATNTNPSNGPNARANGRALRCLLSVGADLSLSPKYYPSKNQSSQKPYQ